MRGRRITKGQTLCGWSWDNDRADNRDGDPKVLIILGKSTISRGFKYTKQDRMSLDVSLSPGDVLVLYGEARSWASAVNGFEEDRGRDGPFDFVHMWLLDHRRLRQLKPNVYDSIHNPGVPKPGGAEYRWMQFAYTVLNKCDADGQHLVELRDSQAPSRVQLEAHARREEPSRDTKTRGTGRRWKSKQGSESQNAGEQWPDTLAGA